MIRPPLEPQVAAAGESRLVSQGHYGTPETAGVVLVAFPRSDGVKE